MNIQRGFASDNNSGVHELIMKSLIEANGGHVIAYGDDKYTQQAIATIQNLFDSQPEVFFVTNGTGANVLSLNATGKSFHTVFCAETAHINVDECGAPEKFTGMKLVTTQTLDGKLKKEHIEPHLHTVGFEHHTQPGVISITQPTELGTLYTANEIKDLADFAHDNNMFLHVDGARISNAVAATQLSISEMLEKTGVDVLSFGGTKNGMMYGEAVVFLNTKLAANFKYFRKQSMQLASKMRFIGAQFNAFFKDDLWIKNASHANRMAELLYNKVKDIKNVKVTQPVQANGVFAIIPKNLIPKLQDEYFFYVWDDNTGEVRWMCSFDTTEEDINIFAGILRELVGE